MALGFGFSASGAGTVSGSTVTGTSILNNANAVSVLYVTHYANGAFAETSSITDASGGTWNLRKRVRFQSAWLGSGSTANASYIVQETWWKNDVSSTNRALTLNVPNASSIVKSEWIYQSITGSLSVAAPWDTHASLTSAAQTFGNPITTTAAITLGVTTAQNNSQVLAILSEIMSTSASTASSTGTGMTAVNNQTDGVSPNQFHMFLQNKLQATAGAVTASATNNKQSFIFTADALTGTSTGSSASAGTLDIASIQNLSSGNTGMGTGAAVTFTFTNTAPCIIVANFDTVGGTALGPVPILSVTDSAGHTWHRRSSRVFDSAFHGLSSSAQYITHEVWWANVTAVHGSNVTVTVNKSSTASNEVTQTSVSWATFTGSMAPTTPWDTSATLGKLASHSDNAVASAPTNTWAVTSLNDLILGGLVQMGQTGNTNVGTAPTGYTLGSAHAVLGNSTTGPLQNALAWTTSQQTGLSGTQTWNGTNTLEWTLFVDALSGDLVGTATEVASAILAIHGLPVETFDNSGAASTIACTITTTLPAIIIAVINTENFSPAGTPRTVSSVSGGGLTWAKRSGQTGNLSGSNGSMAQEVWWANATGTLTAQAITATLSGIPSQNTDMMVFAVTGSNNPTTPWDTNGGLPAHNTRMTGTSGSMTITGSLSSTAAMLLTFDTYAWNSHAQSTIPGGGNSDISPNKTGTSLNMYWNAAPSGAAGSKTSTYGVSQDFWLMTLDALNGDAAIPPAASVQPQVNMCW
jgi:hypothetical protein